MSCPHENFTSQVNVFRFQGDDGSITSYSADIMTKCADCGEPFQFLGVPGGVSPTEPHCSVDGTELRAPIRPISEWIP